MTGPRRLPGSVAVVVAALILVVLAALSVRPADTAAPRDDSTVVATLQTQKPHSPSLLAALRASRAAPDDLVQAKAAARLLIADGRAAGDSRLVGAAIGVLRPFLADPDAETLLLEATARQYQHDFTGALELLDRAITLDPRNIDALLTRATIQTVLGRFTVAAEDCARISALGRAEVGFLCQSTALLLTSRAPLVAERLGAILARPGLLDPALTGWAEGLLGELAVLRGDDAAAKPRFEAVIARDPGVIRERLLLSDLLLRQGEPASVLTLLDGAPEVDGVLIRRVLAARALGRASIAEPATAELERRVRLNLDLGLKAHAREETLYFLLIARDPAMALARAEVNWALQHEIEDAQLLLDAAVAAGQPQAAAPVLVWITAEDIAVPVLRIPDSLRAPQ